MRLLVRRSFRDDLSEISLKVWEERPDAARRLLAEVQLTLLQLQAFPMSGKAFTPKTVLPVQFRVAPIRGFPSLRVYYFIEGNDLQVVRIIHGARDVEKLLDPEG